MSIFFSRPGHSYWLAVILIYWPLTFVLTSLHEYWHTLFQEGVATALGVPMNKVKVRSRRLGKLELRCASECCRFHLMPFCNYACLWLNHKAWVKCVWLLWLATLLYTKTSCVVICRTCIQQWNIWSHDDTAHIVCCWESGKHFLAIFKATWEFKMIIIFLFSHFEWEPTASAGLDEPLLTSNV